MSNFGKFGLGLTTLFLAATLRPTPSAGSFPTSRPEPPVATAGDPRLAEASELVALAERAGTPEQRRRSLAAARERVEACIAKPDATTNLMSARNLQGGIFIFEARELIKRADPLRGVEREQLMRDARARLDQAEAEFKKVIEQARYMTGYGFGF